MWYKVTFLVLLFSGILSGQNESAVDESNIILNFGPTGNEYFNLFNSGNTNFNGLNIGTFECDDTFILNGAQQLTHKCGDHDITYSELNYSIEPVGNLHTSFNTLEIFFNVDLAGSNYCSNTSIDQNWQTDGAGINVLSGLTPGTYELQVFTRTERRDSSVNLSDLFISNFGDNFTATFTIIDTTPPSLVGVPVDDTVECDAIPALPTVTATDNCDTTLSVNYSEVSNTVIDGVGTIVREWSVTDNGGNTTIETQTISVADSTPPSLVGVPVDLTVECDAIPALPTVTATDNCDTALSVNYSEVSNNVIDGVGTIVREWSVTDNGGNTTIETQTITVEDTTVPTASNPAPINVQCLGDVPVVDTSVVIDEADNCGIPTVTFVSQTGDPAVNDGTITRTYRVDDGNGNSIEVTQDIIINDTTVPTASNPDPINVQCIDNVPAVDTSVVIDEADNCGLPTVTFVSQTGDPAVNDGTITRIYRVDDGNGNSIEVTQDIFINDTTPPTASNPDPINVQCIDDVPAVDTSVVIDEADNCGLPTVTFVSQTGDPAINDGTITRTYRVDDGNGNSIEVTQDIIINDTTVPTASNPAPINVQCLGDVPVVDTSVVTDATDNCGLPTVTFVSQTADPAVNDGTITRTYRVDDGNGNSIEVTQDIIINDTTVPTASNPAPINVQCLGDVPVVDTSVVTDEADNCGLPTVTFVSQTGDPAVNDGTITRTYRVDDGNGNSIEVTQDIIINDTTAPTASNPDPINVQCLSDVPAVDTSVVIDATDNCGLPTVTFVSQTGDPAVNDGTITRTYRVDDGNGNSIEVTQDIIINDTTPPTASNPDPINVQCLSDVPAVDTSVVIDETDNCGLPTVTFVSQTADPAVNDGTITRTYRIDDGNGNSIEVTQNIIINDTTPPTASNPDPINVQCLGDVPAVDTSVVIDEADNCGLPTVTFVSQTADPAVNDGTITRTYRVDDGNGNSIEVTQDIIINDTTVPTASNPAPINVQCLGDVPVVDTSVVTDATDNCGLPTVTFVSQTGDPAVNDGTITRTYRVDDGNGNSIEVTQDIIINDTTAPTASNPDPINVQCLSDVPAVDTSVVIDEADNCGLPTVTFVSQTADPAVNDGTITRTYRIDDGNGNSIEVTQNIIINDTTPPTASNPDPINVQCLGDVPAVDTSVVIDEADNCGLPTVTFVSQTGDPAVNDGTITRTYRIDDGNGNSIEVTQNIIINDTTPPTASNPDPINVQCLGDVPVVDTSVVIDEADNCGLPTVTFVSQTGDPAVNDGTITRTYRVDDGNGNSIEVTQDIIINDTTPPTASNPDPINVQCIDDVPAVDTSVVIDEADNCGLPTVTFVSQTADPAVNDGTITRTYRVDDGNGNSIEVTQDIIINDTTAPTASNPAPINVQCLGDVPAVDTSVVTDEADNCGLPTVTFVSQTGDPAVNDGTITRTYRVDDGNGNSIEVTQDIIINDTTPPTASNPAPINVQCLGDVPVVDTSVVIDEADNCGLPTVTFVSQTGDPAVNDGTITRTYRVDDGNGNFINITQLITIEDTIAPTFIESLPQANITVECDALPTAVVLTAADNCGNAAVALAELRTDGDSPFEYTLTRTWTAEDNSGNQTSYTQTITVIDTTLPLTPTLAPIEADCSLTVAPPTTTDSCEGTITGTTSTLNLTFDSPGIYEIFWVFTDSAGNQSDPVLQEITIIDEAPVPPTSIAPLTISGCQISGYDDLIIPTATDFCDGVAIAGTLGDDFIFPFIFDGTQTILWEFTDSNGNTEFQSQEITLDPLPVTGGTLAGTYEGNVFENQVDIGSCDAETIVQMDLTGQSGTIVRWERFATNEGIWIEIPNTNNTFTATFAAGFLVSTYYRALVQNGTCGEYSSQFFIRALPSGEPPTVEILNAADSYCLGDEIRINATSQILISDEETNIAYENGNLNAGQLNNNDEASWLVDGEVGGWTSGGSASKPKNWSGKVCNNNANGNIVYCGDEGKFGIAYGNYNQTNGQNGYNGPNPTTLESPITDLSNAVAASVNFDQAYNFAVGDLARVEITFNGASATAERIYVPLFILHNPGDPATNWFDAGNAENYLDSTATIYNFTEDNTSISLQAYLDQEGLDLSQVRIRWTFSGTANESAWALDNINVNATIYQETDLELTDGIGNPADNPILIGQTNQEFTITPTAPGIHEYGVTTLINDCRTYDGAGTNFFTIPVSYAFAGENVSLLGGDCGQNLVQLNAYDNTLTAVQNAAKGAYIIPVDCIDCDDPGTGASGQWTITGVDVCGSAAFTSENPLYAGQEASDPNAIFTAEEGSYTLIWTVEGCSSSIQVDIENCNQVDFDGTDDYVDFGSDNFSLSNAFSIEVWVKLESLGGRQTILSKRDANFTGNEFGYDLTVGNSGLVEFTFNKEGSNGGKLSSAPFNINTDRWYHIAITRSASGAYRLYVDGILLDSDAGNAPGANTFRALLGAMDNGPSASNNFNGWIDEVKIWNTALTAEQIRFMMNQEIIQSPTIAGNVQGATIPLDIPNLSWTNLSGYYKMESTNIGCGYLNSTLGNNIRGKLKNITSQLTRNAPLPYTSSSDGNWTNVSTWTNPTVWNIPNSNGINGDPIDWNIVRTAHNISSGDKDITVLGLLVDANELSIEDSSTALNETNDGQMLWVTHYLKIDGKIDLVGESQLVQKTYAPTQLSESFFDSTSTGYIERDQQGTGNPFNYNYWGSPVAASNASVTSNNISTNTFSIASVLFDGTISRTNPINFPVTWTNNYTAVSSTSVAQVSNRWIYTYADNLSNTYSVWDFVSNTTSFNTGLGFTMKGSGTDTEPFDGTYQNYVFIGKPNNGTIINTISANNDALLGNPYPSAIDADQFIRDNIPGSGTGSIDGSLYFWEHFLSNNTHITSDYIGGYAIYNLTGSVAAVTPPLTSDGVAIIGGNGTRRPERYIPVSQGFFVSSGQTGGGEIVFNNNQRAFRREAFTGASNNGSLFFRNSSSTAAVTNSDDDLMKRIRLSFESGNGAVRQLLLGFEPNNLATDGLDYGYDALNNDNFPNDLLWIIDGEGYVIQGVGQFDVTKVYPLSLILNENSLIEIQITEFENFENIPDVFIYDALLGTYTLINENSFEMQMDAGIYNERFFIAFQDSSALSIDDTTEEENFKSLMLYYAFNRNKIVILNPNYIELEHLEIFNIMGQSVGVVSDLYQTSYNEYEVPNLSSGAYIVQLRTPNGVLTKKIIIK